MNLLMVTRKIDRNDALAGFAYAWVKRLAEKLKEKDSHSRVFVICLEKGDTGDMPENVEVSSLGKEAGVNRKGRFFEFQKLAWKYVPKSDGIFCHMNPEYTINIWPYAKLFRKKIVSWYTHGAVTWKTRMLEKMANVILTASQKSFRISSKKVVVTGHGIDVNHFQKKDGSVSRRDGILKILTVGRISPTKDIESIILAVEILVKSGVENTRLDIIGEPGLAEQFRYFEMLRQMALRMGLGEAVRFLGPIPHREIREHLLASDVFINLSGTEAIDKAVLEAMSCECMVFTSNSAFEEILPKECMVEKDQPRKLAEKILWFWRLDFSAQENLRKILRDVVVKNHTIENLIAKIIEQFR